MFAHLSLATSISFAHHFSDALVRSTLLGDFVFLVVLVEYAVDVLMVYLQAA